MRAWQTPDFSQIFSMRECRLTSAYVRLTRGWPQETTIILVLLDNFLRPSQKLSKTMCASSSIAMCPSPINSNASLHKSNASQHKLTKQWTGSRRSTDWKLHGRQRKPGRRIIANKFWLWKKTQRKKGQCRLWTRDRCIVIKMKRTRQPVFSIFCLLNGTCIFTTTNVQHCIGKRWQEKRYSIFSFILCRFIRAERVRCGTCFGLYSPNPNLFVSCFFFLFLGCVSCFSLFFYVCVVNFSSQPFVLISQLHFDDSAMFFFVQRSISIIYISPISIWLMQ